jgi:RNase adapter protein RapZ
MKTPRPVKKVLLVTGLSGAGKTTALKTLEDLGWEAVDNFPIRLAGPLLALPSPEGRNDDDIPLCDLIHAPEALIPTG